MQVRLLPWVIASDDLIATSYAPYLFDPFFHEDSDFDLHFGSFYHPEAVPRPFLARVLSLSLYFFSLLEEEPPFSLLLLLLLLTEAAAAFALVASTSPACFRHSFVCACAALMISSLAAASARKDSARSLAMASST